MPTISPYTYSTKPKPPVLAPPLPTDRLTRPPLPTDRPAHTTRPPVATPAAPSYPNPREALKALGQTSNSQGTGFWASIGKMAGLDTSTPGWKRRARQAGQLASGDAGDNFLSDVAGGHIKRSDAGPGGPGGWLDYGRGYVDAAGNAVAGGDVEDATYGGLGGGFAGMNMEGVAGQPPPPPPTDPAETLVSQLVGKPSQPDLAPPQPPPTDTTGGQFFPKPQPKPPVLAPPAFAPPSPPSRMDPPSTDSAILSSARIGARRKRPPVLPGPANPQY